MKRRLLEERGEHFLNPGARYEFFKMILSKIFNTYPDFIFIYFLVGLGMESRASHMHFTIELHS
jgi:hypothetical protein